jgi:hypothetical protein
MPLTLGSRALLYRSGGGIGVGVWVRRPLAVMAVDDVQEPASDRRPLRARERLDRG